MRIEPEEVLKENRIAAKSGVEEAEMEHALEAGEEKRDGDNRSAEDKNDAGGVVRPDKERQPEPGHARSAHGVDGDDEIQAGEDGRKSVDEDADDGGRHGGIRIDAAERRVKGPTGIEAAGGEGIEHETAAGNVDVPAQEVELGKGDVFRANHQGNEKIPEDGGDGRNQEEENHRHAVHGKELVVSLWRNQVTRGRKQVNADHGGEDAADEKEKSD